jgi:hypothetical protein
MFTPARKVPFARLAASAHNTAAEERERERERGEESEKLRKRLLLFKITR